MGLVYRGGRPYLYRSVRRGGRVTSEYVASGERALLFSQLDAEGRQEAEAEREDWEAERERMEAEDRAVTEMFDRVETLVVAALVAAGFHRHKNQWRRRRG